MNQSVEGGGTFTIPSGATVDKNTRTCTFEPAIQLPLTQLVTALTPFWNTQNSFWTSANSIGTVPTQLGYSYPEFNGLDLGNQEAVKTRIARIVNQLYGGRSRQSILSPVVNLAAAPQQKVAAESAVTPGAPVPTSEAHAKAVSKGDDDEPDVSVTIADGGSGSSSGGIWDWTARIHVKKYAVGSSFSVLLFLGEVPENPADWRTSPHYAGAHHAFVNSAPQQCANCRRQQELVIEGFVHLNEAIAAHSGLGTFEPDAVQPYLQENLHWRVLKVSIQCVCTLST